MLRLDIEKRLPGFHLRVALEAQENFLVLFGPSGAGKSLTLQCIAGLVKPDAGSIQVGDRVVFDADTGINLPSRHRRVGYVFQNHALFPHLTAAQNVAYGLRRVPPKERTSRVQEALRTVQLEGLEGRKPRELSGGQQQRVALARALVVRPDVVLLDEPFASLDTLLREQLQAELRSLLHQTQVPAVLVTHDLDEAYALSHEIAIYDAGRVLQYGPKEEVYHRPISHRAAELVEVKNILPGIVNEVTRDHVEVAGPGFTLWGPVAPVTAGERVECCIRPEDVTLADAGPGVAVPAHRQSPLECTLVDEVIYGNRVALVFRPETTTDAAGAFLLHATLPLSVYRQRARENRRTWTVLLDAERLHVIRSESPPARRGS